jgi:type I restriction enzyme R subunit
LLINGIPVVVGEAKTPIRPSVSWLDGAHEIHHVYENAIPSFLFQIFYHLQRKARLFFMGAFDLL